MVQYQSRKNSRRGFWTATKQLVLHAGIQDFNLEHWLKSWIQAKNLRDPVQELGSNRSKWFPRLRLGPNSWTGFHRLFPLIQVSFIQPALKTENSDPSVEICVARNGLNCLCSFVPRMFCLASEVTGFSIPVGARSFARNRILSWWPMLIRLFSLRCLPNVHHVA